MEDKTNISETTAGSSPSGGGNFSQASAMTAYATELAPLGDSFEGFSSAGATAAPITGPAIVPPVPLGMPGKTYKANITVGRATVKIPMDIAMIQKAIEEHERYNIHCMVTMVNNGGGF